MPHKQGKIFDQAVDHDQKQGDPYIDITKAQGNPYPASAHAFNGLADHNPAAKQRRIRHKRVQHKGAQPSSALTALVPPHPGQYAPVSA